MNPLSIEGRRGRGDEVFIYRVNITLLIICDPDFQFFIFLKTLV